MAYKTKDNIKAPVEIPDKRDPERLEGMREIRQFINPGMSERDFWKQWRKKLEPILMERSRWRFKKKPKYFTYKRLVLAIMLEEYKPKGGR